MSHINLDRAFDEKSASEFKIGRRSIGADLSQRRSAPCHSKCHDNDVSGPDTSHGVVLQPALTCALTFLSRVARLQGARGRTPVNVLTCSERACRALVGPSPASSTTDRWCASA